MIALEYCFKGDRKYVHGTDVFDSLTKFFLDKGIYGLDIKFNDIIEKNLFLVDGWNQSDKKVDITTFSESGSKKYQLIESDSQINCETQYDEALIIRNSALGNKSIISKIDNEYTLIENIVPLNKVLVSALFPENEGGWYFTRLVLSITPEKFKLKKIKLTFVNNFGLRLIKTKISLDGLDIGDIYFSSVKGK